MSSVLKDGVRNADEWLHLDDVPLLPVASFTIPNEVWQARKLELLRVAATKNVNVGVRLRNGDDPTEIGDGLEHLTLIVIDVEHFEDGRFFSIASRLRERLGYRHELRVCGDVRVDQLVAMQRCGIDSFAVEDSVDIRTFENRYQRFYQLGTVPRHPLIRDARRADHPQ